MPPTCAARVKLHPREPHGRREMNSLFQAEKPSLSMRITIVVAGVVFVCLALWAGITMGLIVGSGQ
jgi:hypothetical protein